MLPRAPSGHLPPRGAARPAALQARPPRRRPCACGPRGRRRDHQLCAGAGPAVSPTRLSRALPFARPRLHTRHARTTRWESSRPPAHAPLPPSARLGSLSASCSQPGPPPSETRAGPRCCGKERGRPLCPGRGAPGPERYLCLPWGPLFPAVLVRLCLPSVQCPLRKKSQALRTCPSTGPVCSAGGSSWECPPPPLPPAAVRPHPPPPPHPAPDGTLLPRLPPASVTGLSGLPTPV